MADESNLVLTAKQCSPSGCIGIPDAVLSFTPWLYYGLTAICLGISCFLLHRWLKDPTRTRSLAGAISILVIYTSYLGQHLAAVLKLVESGAKPSFVPAAASECNAACDTARQIRDFMEFAIYAVLLIATTVTVYMFGRWRQNPKDLRLLAGAVIVPVFAAAITMVYEIYV